jgi:RNA polymerase sigma-70 factor (ECF subfamily)
LCRDTALVDDLAQETFVQAWMHLGGLRASAAFAGWLRQLAINSWRQHLRHERVLGKLATAEVFDAVSAPATAARLDLDSALDALAPGVRLCIVLSYHEGMSHGEIAAAAQLPLGTVKSHIARGTARLRELLAAYHPTHEQPADER